MNKLVLEITFDQMHRQHGIKLTNIDPVQARILHNAVCNYFIDTDDYKQKQKTQPFLQGYDDFHEEDWVFIEFWTDNMENIKAYTEYLQNQVNDEGRYERTKEMMIAFGELKETSVKEDICWCCGSLRSEQVDKSMKCNNKDCFTRL